MPPLEVRGAKEHIKGFSYRGREAHTACSPQRFHGSPSAVHVFGSRILSHHPATCHSSWVEIATCIPPLQNLRPLLPGSSGVLEVRVPLRSHQDVADCQALFANFRCLPWVCTCLTLRWHNTCHAGSQHRTGHMTPAPCRRPCTVCARAEYLSLWSSNPSASDRCMHAP